MRRGWALALLGIALVGGVGCQREPPQARAWRSTASELRDLRFEHRVPFRLIESEDVPSLLLDEVPLLRDQAFVDAYRDAYAALGVLPRDLDLGRTYLELGREQIAGLYSVRRSRMYVVVDEYTSKPSRFASVAVHELIHALQHQHFGELLELMQALRRHDDLLTAVASAVEGDASLIMLMSDSSDPSDPARYADARVRSFHGSLLHEIAHPEGRLAEAPRLLRHSLLFPYAHGIQLAWAHYRDRGPRGLDALLRDPPLSTLHVLHPGLEVPVEFVRLPSTELRALAGPGCRLGPDNVAGALTLRTLFEEHAAVGTPRGERAAVASETWLDAWRGDRFVHANCGQHWEIAWLTRWATPADAAAFARAYAGIAASVAQGSPLLAAAQVALRGRTALVASGPWSRGAERILAGVEIRALRDLAEWQAADCFPESPCPLRTTLGRVPRETSSGNLPRVYSARAGEESAP